VHGYQKGWSGNKYKLKAPEPDVRHWEVMVVADILASRLQGVTGEVGLFITPNAFSRHHQYHDSKYEEYGEPYFADAGGMFVDSSDDFIKSSPIHAAWWLFLKNREEHTLDTMYITQYNNDNTVYCSTTTVFFGIILIPHLIFIP
uniref:Uncharacterized protein n=1 Tax=Leptobrachium leishanense TaxID=445787 RepID=A0A8C5LY84_9ANUR